MKTMIAALAAVTALSAVAVVPAAAQPYGPPGYHHGWGHGPRYAPRPHKVCFMRHYHRVCRWVR
jgi:Spy/CpxP family protein refolding chaperone